MDRKDPKKRWSGTVTQVGSLTAENTSNNNGGNKQQENPNQGKYPYTVELDQGGEMPLVGSHSYVNIVENAPEAGKVVVNKAYTFSKNGKTYVWKVEGKTLKLQEVKTKKVLTVSRDYRRSDYAGYHFNTESRYGRRDGGRTAC